MSYKVPEWFKQFQEKLEESKQQEVDDIKSSEDRLAHRILWVEFKTDITLIIIGIFMLYLVFCYLKRKITQCLLWKNI